MKGSEGGTKKAIDRLCIDAAVRPEERSVLWGRWRLRETLSHVKARMLGEHSSGEQETRAKADQFTELSDVLPRVGPVMIRTGGTRLRRKARNETGICGARQSPGAG